MIKFLTNLNKNKTVQNLQNLVFVLFFMVVLYRIIFYKYSFLSQVLLFLFFLLGVVGILSNIKKESKFVQVMLFSNFLISLFLFFYSLLYQQNNPLLVMRFFLITNLLILSYFYPANEKMKYIFLYVVFLHALFIVAFEIFMIFNYDMSNYGEIRFYINGIGIGDVYTYDGKFWRIQLAGNHLLPLAFFISMITLKGKKKFFMSIIFFISSIFSGHFAFLISIFIFLIGYYITNRRVTYNNIIKLFLSFFILITIFSKPIYEYVSDVLDRKADISLSTRNDQVNVLLNDMSSNALDLIFGKGYGNTVDVSTEYRNYKNKIYYELQTFYIFNQMGFAMMMWYLVLNIYLTFLKLNDKYVIFIYLSFLIYAFTNPYIFDSTHIFIITVLLSLIINKKQQRYLNDKK